jgi:hypothetical protein
MIIFQLKIKETGRLIECVGDEIGCSEPATEIERRAGDAITHGIAAAMECILKNGVQQVGEKAVKELVRKRFEELGE